MPAVTSPTSANMLRVITPYDLDSGQKQDYHCRQLRESNDGNCESTAEIQDQDEEAKWWASPEGRAFLRAQALSRSDMKGSRLVSELGRKSSV